MKPNFKESLISLINDSAKSLDIVNSWLTDGDIIELIMKKSKEIKIKIILSADVINAYRYKDIKSLQKSNVDVRILGSEILGTPNFMHAKYIIIDEYKAYGGSYNLTESANSNYECFYQFHDSEFTKIKSYFNSMYNISKVYAFTLDDVKDQIILKEMNNQNFHRRLIDSFSFQSEIIEASKKSYSILDFNFINGYYVNEDGYKLDRLHGLACRLIHDLNLKYTIWEPKNGSEWCNAELISSIEEYENEKSRLFID
jgi:phosphatidylserine/phosphatidylglycerophosphate/cardiolipin synthase-like enzyme